MAKKNSQSGIALLEVLIATGLLLLVAVALIPALSELRESGKAVEFKVACSAIVRAKLQEYLSGSPSDTSTTDANAGDYGQVLSGFEYTRGRMHEIAAGGVASPCTADPFADTTSPGFRERIANNTVVSDTFATDISADNLPPGFQGFQLWVNLRHYNPRDLLDSSCNAGPDGTPDRCCPASLTGTNKYQFLRSGDGIEVTVTGMIRTNTSTASGGRGCRPYAGIYDLDPSSNSDLTSTSGTFCNNTADDLPNPILTCSVTEIVYAPKLMFRYYLGNDGHIRSLQSTPPASGGGATAESAESHFRNIWSECPSGTSPCSATINAPAIANILSFAVSPNNETVYVMKPGTLVQYGGATQGYCSDGQTVMRDSGDTTDITFNGVPNCPATPEESWANTGTVYVGNSVEQIAVDFNAYDDETDDEIYGYQNAGSSGLTVAGTSNKLRKFNAATLMWDDTDTTFTVQPVNRTLSVFIAPNTSNVSGFEPQLYVVDNTCYEGPTGWTGTGESTHCVSAYNADDSQYSFTMDDLRIQVIGVSN